MRTKKQNNALHKFCELLATHLNDNNLDQKVVLTGGVLKYIKTLLEKALQYIDVQLLKEIPWTKESVKASLIKPLVKAMYGHDSTTKLEKSQVGDLHEVLMKHLGEKYGLPYLEFPHEEDKQ